MSARMSRCLPSTVPILGLAFLSICLPVEAIAQRGGGGRGGFGGGHSFGGGGFHGGGGFGGARMAPRVFRPSSPPMPVIARGPQGYRGGPRYPGPRYSRGVPRSSYYRPMTRPVAGPRGSRLAGGNRITRPGPGSARLGSRGRGPGLGQGFGGGRHHHRFFNSNSWFNPFYSSFFLSPFFWAPYPFYDACTPYYSDYGDNGYYTNEYGPPEENEAEAPAEEYAAPESEEVSGETLESQLAPAPLEQRVVVELSDGRTKTFTWKGDRMIVTESPAPSKAAPAPPAPQSPPTGLEP